MNDDALQDLKQFITATVSQQTADVRSDISKLEDKLTTKIDELSESVAEAIEATNEVTGDQLKDHEVRITRLEKKVA